MASVDLRPNLWLHDAHNPADYVAVPWLEGSGTPQADGQVRTYAGGRRRLVRRKGKHTPVSYQLPLVRGHVQEWIEAHVGELVMARDSRGRLTYGTYLEVVVTEWKGSRAVSIAISIDPVTFSSAA